MDASPELESSGSRFNDRLPRVSVIVNVQVPPALSESNASTTVPFSIVVWPSRVHVQAPDGWAPLDVRAHVQLARTESLPC